MLWRAARATRAGAVGKAEGMATSTEAVIGADIEGSPLSAGQRVGVDTPPASLAYPWFVVVFLMVLYTSSFIDRQILSILAAAPAGEVCVCDFVEPVGKSQPTVSHHLKVLSEAGLVEGARRTKWVWYRLVPERLAALQAASCLSQ